LFNESNTLFEILNKSSVLRGLSTKHNDSDSVSKVKDIPNNSKFSTFPEGGNKGAVGGNLYRGIDKLKQSNTFEDGKISNRTTKAKKQTEDGDICPPIPIPGPID
jgi:hypothetical protein